MIRSTFEAARGQHYATLMSDLIRVARDAVAKADDQDELTFLRIRTKKNEIMICPVLIPESS
ncbi:hypothetical protein BGZ99_005909 [Dissophora globulifera]|uniref:Roadblock/LAMTOR2 domain-containing protein n=1 Tax=Dissophora globulifera TaxID=979702 RepID=A0A9P6USS4_9FUNG|nr:hypothetical protein BGZ99_005909 [Dissophora globulifera]